jgi:hypothetical protein
MATAGVAPGICGGSMSDPVRILGVFPGEEECAEGIESLRRAGYTKLEVFSPIPSDRVLEALESKKSPVGAFVLAGGILGVLSGFALTIGTSLTWSHVAGGKPIISIPAYIIPSYELMILLGALSGIGAFLMFARLPAFESKRGYSERFSGDRFGVWVTCGPDQTGRAEALLRNSGAEEVERETA